VQQRFAPRSGIMPARAQRRTWPRASARAPAFSSARTIAVAPKVLARMSAV
jgi:hypothetical protein